MNVTNTGAPLSRYCLVKWMEGRRSGIEEVVPRESILFQPQLDRKICRVWTPSLRSATKYLRAWLVFHHDDFHTVVAEDERRTGFYETTQPTGNGNSKGEKVDEKPRYFVVQFKELNEYVCVPASWLRPVDEASDLKVNAEALVGWLERWDYLEDFISYVKRGNPPVFETFCSVICVFATDCYEVGSHWILMMNYYYPIISANKKVIEDEAGTVPRSRSPLSSCPRPAKIPRTADNQLPSTLPPPPHSCTTATTTSPSMPTKNPDPTSTLATSSLTLPSTSAPATKTSPQTSTKNPDPTSTSVTSSLTLPSTSATATKTSPQTSTKNPDPTSTSATSSLTLPSTSATATKTSPQTSTKNPDPTSTSATSSPTLPSTSATTTSTSPQTSTQNPDPTAKQSSNINPTSAVNSNLSEAVKITKKEIQNEFIKMLNKIAEVNVELERKCKETVMNIQSNSIKFHEAMKPYYDYVKTGAQETN